MFLPNCNYFITNPDDFRQHFADHIFQLKILDQSFSTNGYIWSIIIYNVKIRNKIPTVRKFLGIPDTNILIQRNVISNNSNIPILILLRNIDFNFNNSPPRSGLINRNMDLTVPGLPIQFIDGGLIIENIDLNNINHIPQIPLNNDPRVKEITNNLELINCEVCDSIPIIEEVSDELMIRDEKINELSNKLLLFILQIIKNNFRNNSESMVKFIQMKKKLKSKYQMFLLSVK